MNVTFFIGGLSGGGAERVTCNIANYLSKNGHNVKILTMADDKPTYAINKEILRIPLLHTNERRGFVINSIVRLYRFIKHLIKDNVDVYVVMLPITTIMLLRLRWLIKGKVIASERVDPSIYPSSKQKQLRSLAKKADGWVFQTEEERNWYGVFTGKAKVQIIPNAINSDFIKEPYQGERKKTIVTAGRLTEQKNHVLLLKAFAKISLKNPDYQLIIYGGGGNLKDKIEETAKQLNIEDRVMLPGYTTNIGDKIKDSSLFVLSSDFEGMPNALMEAMALGLPCVSTDCKGGGAKFLIDDGKNGLLTPIGDVDALAKAIDKMLSDREFAEHCGKEAHKICERLAPGKIYNEWEKFILETINR